MRPLATTTAGIAAPVAASRRAEASKVDPLARRLLAGLLLLVGSVATLINWPRPSLPVDAARLSVELEGLDCGFWCPVGVDAVLQQLPGVEVRSVDVRTGTVDVAHDPRRSSAAAIVQRLGGHWRVRRAQASAGPDRPAVELPASTWAATAWPASPAFAPESPATHPASPPAIPGRSS